MDPLFAKVILVNEKHPLRVFVQLEGDCNGVFVTNKTANGFDVVELQNGASNVSFTFTVVGNRANETYGQYAEERFAPSAGPLPSGSIGAAEVEPTIFSNQSNESTTKTIELVELPDRNTVQTKAQMKKDDKEMIMIPKNTETQTRPK